MAELATAYISVVAETSGIPRQIRAALGSAQRDATSAGRSTGNSFASSFGSSLKGIGAAAGVTGGIAAVAGAMKSAISSGMDFTTSLNTMQAVAGASSAQIAQVSEKARQLGTDNQLAATSSVDAAQAMVELAKGGFTVDQSMQAARGTLQLAAAAQISAADAATIQSQALQAFGKDASFAGTASDILANAANQSSAEITDVAMAFQQSGAVANQFGLSMNDTAATIALLANAGIQGSDAGTLLKSTLLALTDQGKPAQAAIQELGLTVYDAQGKFVGMEQLFGQLQTASKRMTPEMYQAATATLFGSDAARIAGVAAQQGAQGFDKMRDAMGQQGAAAAVAAAKMNGLPGAWEKFKNAAQDAGLAFYDAVQGPLTAAATWAADAIGNITDGASGIGQKFKDVFASVSDAFQSAGGMDLISGWGDRLKGIFDSLMDSAQELFPVVGKLAEVFGQASAVIAVVGVETFVSALEAAAQILSVAVVPILQLANSVLSAMQPLVVAGVAAWLGFKAVAPALAAMRAQMTTLSSQTTATTTRMRNFTEQMRVQQSLARMSGTSIGVMGSAVAVLGTQYSAIGRMQGAFITASEGATRFSRTAGTAAAVGSGLRSVGSGIAGVFGGPMGLALAGVTAGIGIFASSSAQAKSAQEGLQQAIKGTADAQTALNEALFASRGAVDDNVMGLAAKRVSAIGDEYDAVQKKRQSFMGALGDTSTWKQAITFGGADSNYDKTNAAADAAKRAQDALDGLKMSDQQLAAAVTGNQGAFDNVRARLVAMGDGGKDAASKLAQTRADFLLVQETARRTTPGFTELQQAMQKYSDSTASATDKSNALKNALDALNPARGKQAAMAQFNDTVRQVADSTKEAVDQTRGYGQALIAAGGAINTTSQNGSDLQKTLTGIVDATVTASSAGADMNDVNAKNQQAFQQLANQYGISIGDIKRAADTLGLSDISVVVGLKGANETVQGLGAVQAELGKIPAGQPKVVEVQSGQLTKDTRTTLEQMGFKLQDIDRNGVKTVQISANDLASGALNAVLAKLIQTGNTNANPQVVLNDSQFRVADQNARQQLGSLASQIADPKANLIIDQLVQGKTVSIQQLQQLDQTIANPQVRMEVQKILANIQLVNDALDRTAQARTAYINAQVTGLNYGDRTQSGQVFRGPGLANNADGSIRKYAQGGVNNLPDSAMIQRP
ncbi:phage tail tape measure protein, partial [Williamsia serinedens]